MKIGGFPGGSVVEESTCQCRRHGRHGFNPWIGKIPWNRKWQPTPVFLPEKSHGQRSLSGPRGHQELNMTEHTHTVEIQALCKRAQQVTELTDQMFWERSSFYLIIIISTKHGANGGEVWQNVVHRRKEWQTTSVFLPWELHEQYKKAKWQDTERGTPQVSRCPICYWRSVEK